jgi:hypothetical protein
MFFLQPYFRLKFYNFHFNLIDLLVNLIDLLVNLINLLVNLIDLSFDFVNLGLESCLDIIKLGINSFYPLFNFYYLYSPGSIIIIQVRR